MGTLIKSIIIIIIIIIIKGRVWETTIHQLLRSVLQLDYFSPSLRDAREMLHHQSLKNWLHQSIVAEETNQNMGQSFILGHFLSRYDDFGQDLAGLRANVEG